MEQEAAEQESPVAVEQGGQLEDRLLVLEVHLRVAVEAIVVRPLEQEPVRLAVRLAAAVVGVEARTTRSTPVLVVLVVQD